MRTSTGLDLQDDISVKATNIAEEIISRVKSWKKLNNSPEPVVMRLTTINAIITNIIAVNTMVIFVVLGSGILRYLIETPVYLYFKTP